MTLIVSLDPGGTTGIAYAVGLTGEGWDYKVQQLGPEAHHLVLHRRLERLYWEFEHDDMTVVYESFEYRNKERPGLVLDSVEYIGVTKTFSKANNVPTVKQTASMAKGFVKDKNIKRLGLWSPGQPHAMDALRHLLFYQTTVLKDKAVLERGWKE